MLKCWVIRLREKNQLEEKVKKMEHLLKIEDLKKKDG